MNKGVKSVGVTNSFGVHKEAGIGWKMVWRGKGELLMALNGPLHGGPDREL